MAKSRSKSFPKVVFVVRENEGDENEYLSLRETLQEAAELDEVRHAGRYELVEELSVSTSVLTTIVKKSRK
jgi:hypothetical protein